MNRKTRVRLKKKHLGPDPTHSGPGGLVVTVTATCKRAGLSVIMCILPPASITTSPAALATSLCQQPGPAALINSPGQQPWPAALASSPRRQPSPATFASSLRQQPGEMEGPALLECTGSCEINRPRGNTVPGCFILCISSRASIITSPATLTSRPRQQPSPAALASSFGQQPWPAALASSFRQQPSPAALASSPRQQPSPATFASSLGRQPSPAALVGIPSPSA